MSQPPAVYPEPAKGGSSLRGFRDWAVNTKIRVTFLLMALSLLATILTTFIKVMATWEEHHVMMVHQQTERRLVQEIHAHMRAAEAWESQIRTPDSIINHLQSLLKKNRQLLTHRAEHHSSASNQFIKEMSGTAEAFLQAFRAAIAAWDKKGLDHTSGLHGAMRADAHRLEAILSNFDTAPLRGFFGQMRANEKTFALRNRPRYLAEVKRRHGQFNTYLEGSQISGELRQKIQGLMARYMAALERYAHQRLQDPDAPWKSADYKALDRISREVNKQLRRLYVPNIQRNYLMLRRVEKDYLQRLQPDYVQRMGGVLEGIRWDVGASGISASEMGLIFKGLAGYERAFKELVAQDEIIHQKTVALRQLAVGFHQHVNEAHALVNQESNAEDEMMDAAFSRAINNGFIFALGVILAAFILLGLITTSIISTPLVHLRNRLIEVGKGRLKQTLTVHSRDEIGQLTGAFNRMIAHLGYIEDVFSSMADILLIVSPDGVIERVNHPELFGYSAQQMQGIRVGQVIREAGRPFLMEARIEGMFQEAGVANAEVTLRTREGLEIEALLSGSVMRDQGRISGVILVAKDITRQKHIQRSLEESEQRFRNITQSASDGIIATDAQGRVTFWNPGAQTIFGYAMDEMLGERVNRLMPPSFHKAHNAGMA
ncbi:MAG: PAS domain S-box protein, partial [Magnetococcales bacterium]|nr:PAS domain S-box protein [Magnetococcales bacterium]